MKVAIIAAGISKLTFYSWCSFGEGLYLLDSIPNRSKMRNDGNKMK